MKMCVILVTADIQHNPNGDLPDEMRESALSIWDEVIASLPKFAVKTFDNAFEQVCTPLGLHSGSTWTECLAAALDIHPQFNGANRLELIRAAHKEHGLRA